MLNILVNAYAVSPNWGSEQGMGWNWVVNIAKYCRVHVITEGEWKEDIEKALQHLPQKEHLSFYYLPVSQEIRNMCWNQGDYRFYLYYAQWQERALEKACEIIAKYQNDKELNIDLIHQLNMVGFREPGVLWKIKDLPYVWGPFCGSLPVNLKFVSDMGFTTFAKYAMKNVVNQFQFRYKSRVRAAMKRAAAVITTDAEIARQVKRVYGHEALLIAETGLQSGCVPVESMQKRHDGFFNLLWVGRMIKTKKLDIALKTIARMKQPQVRLHIVGFGNPEEEQAYRQLAKDLGVEHQVIWYGKRENAEVKQLMREMDIFFFTSVLEATSTVVPEAIQNRLPVVCHDICGFGPLIDDTIGRKIPLRSPEQSVADFANVLTELYENRECLAAMTPCFDQVAEKLTYESKAATMYELYSRLCKKS